MSRTHHHGLKKLCAVLSGVYGVGAGPVRAGITPSWWVREFMTAPQRRAVRDWERNAARTPTADLDTLDLPPHGKKPHLYFW